MIRDGSDKIIHATDVVIGDIIRIQSGDRIPADARILVLIIQFLTINFYFKAMQST